MPSAIHPRLRKTVGGSQSPTFQPRGEKSTQIGFVYRDHNVGLPFVILFHNKDMLTEVPVTLNYVFLENM